MGDLEIDLNIPEENWVPPVELPATYEERNTPHCPSNYLDWNAIEDSDMDQWYLQRKLRELEANRLY